MRPWVSCEFGFPFQKEDFSSQRSLSRSGTRGLGVRVFCGRNSIYFLGKGFWESMTSKGTLVYVRLFPFDAVVKSRFLSSVFGCILVSWSSSVCRIFNLVSILVLVYFICLYSFSSSLVLYSSFYFNFILRVCPHFLFYFVHLWLFKTRLLSI